MENAGQDNSGVESRMKAGAGTLAAQITTT